MTGVASYHQDIRTPSCACTGDRCTPHSKAPSFKGELCNVGTSLLDGHCLRASNPQGSQVKLNSIGGDAASLSPCVPLRKMPPSEVQSESGCTWLPSEQATASTLSLVSATPYTPVTYDPSGQLRSSCKALAVSGRPDCCKALRLLKLLGPCGSCNAIVPADESYWCQAGMHTFCWLQAVSPRKPASRMPLSYLAR